MDKLIATLIDEGYSDEDIVEVLAKEKLSPEEEALDDFGKFMEKKSTRSLHAVPIGNDRYKLFDMKRGVFVTKPASYEETERQAEQMYPGVAINVANKPLSFYKNRHNRVLMYKRRALR